MKQTTKKHNPTTKTTTCLSLILLIILLTTTTLITQPTNNTNATPTENNYDAIYYVSANGNDTTNNGLSENQPFATLAKTAHETNNNGINGNYLIMIMTDLTSTACARYYDNTITITSLSDTTHTITRGTGFSTQRENRRAWYNPAMIEIGGDVTPTGPKISLTLKNIILDDAYTYEGTTFRYAGTAPNPDPTNINLNYVQDAIVASYSPNAAIILDKGAELHNFGGMTALRATDGATAIMKDGSLITDIGSTINTRQVSTTSTDYRANGEAAISINTNAHFYMYNGSKITNIANAHSVKLGGVYKCFIDGEIAYMKGAKGMDATDGNQAANHEGRGFKSAILFSGGTTLNPETGNPGAAIIGPNAYIHDNSVKCGAVSINRSSNVIVEIYGKINRNNALAGSRYVLGIPIAAGTNGGGLYIVGGGTIRLEDGSEICNNTVTSSAYGGAASIQQSGARLIMNGGIVSGNLGSATNTPGIVVNKGDASFEMNGGIIDNGPHGLRLYESGSDGTAGKLVLNAGTISGVTLDSGIPFGYSAQRHIFINQDHVVIRTGYVNVAGRNVYLIATGFKIGNPNAATYLAIRSNLPQNWSMPSTDANVIGFWMQKNGRAEFSVAKPTTGTGGANYVASLNVYFAAVQATTANGAIDASIPLKIYPTSIIKVGTIDHVVVSIPLDTYLSGASVVLVQPTTAYDKIVFSGPETLTYDLNANDYLISYTASYNMPQGLHTELITDGHTPADTFFSFTIRPDLHTVPDVSSLTIVSDLFTIVNNPVWDSNTGEFIVTLKLTDTWESAVNLESTFEFNCTLAASDFEEGAFLRLTGDLAIVGHGKTYLIYSNEAKTELIILRGELDISKVIIGDAVDATDNFHFKIVFSDNGTYDGVASGSTITLKGGESKLITGILQNVTYTIVELEANQNGYTTFSSGASGIISDIRSEAVFTNTRNSPSEYTLIVIGSFAGDSSGAGTYQANDTVTLQAGSSIYYLFNGWTANVADIVFEDNTNVTTTFIMPNKNVVITANWLPIQYTISYVLNEGLNAVANPTFYAPLYLPCNIANPTRTGYAFLGWTAKYANGSSSLFPTRSYNITAGTTGDIVLTAYWVPSGIEENKYYTVIYNGNGHTDGSVPVDVKSPYVSGSTVIVLNQGDLIKADHTFIGWTTNPNTAAIDYLPGSTFVVFGDVVLFAVWQPDSSLVHYTVTYKPGLYGTFGEQITTGLQYGDPTPTPPTVTGQAGWKFTSWTPTPSATVTSTAVYTAQWEQIVLTVTFKDWNGTVLKTQEVPYGGSATAPPTPLRDGYIFTGWDHIFTNITTNLTVTAQYAKTSTEASPNKPSPSSLPPNTPPPTTPPPSTTPHSDNETNNKPLTWALVNLILSIAGIILAAIALTFCMLPQHKQKQAQTKQRNVKNQPYGTNNSDTQTKTQKTKKQTHRSFWLITALALGILGLVVFLLTEDMSHMMSMVDRWTIVNAVIFVTEILCLIFVFKSQKNTPKQKPNEPIVSNRSQTTY